MRTIHEAEYIITHLETSHESAGEYIVTLFPVPTDEASYNLNINLKLVPRPAAMTVMTPLLSCRLMHTFIRPPNKYVTCIQSTVAYCKKRMILQKHLCRVG